MNLDSLSTDALFDVACNSVDEDTRWKAISRLHFVGGEDAFQKCLQLLRSTNIKHKIAAVDILAQLMDPDRIDAADSDGTKYKRLHPRKTIDVLLNVVTSASDEDLLASIFYAMGHNKSQRAVSSLVAHKNHFNSDIRYAVCFALLTNTDKDSIFALIDLSKDEDEDVRNWATFGLAQQIDLNTPYIRNALWNRVSDRNNEIRAEAILGLSRRQDKSSIELIICELHNAIEKGECWDQIIEAAFYMPDPRYCEYLEILKSKKSDIWFIDEAIAANRIPLVNEYKMPDTAPSTCPVCGLNNAYSDDDEWQFCRRCGWVLDNDQLLNPHLSNRKNIRSLNKEQRRWLERIEIAKASIKHNSD